MPLPLQWLNEDEAAALEADLADLASLMRNQAGFTPTTEQMLEAVVRAGLESMSARLTGEVAPSAPRAAPVGGAPSPVSPVGGAPLDDDEFDLTGLYDDDEPVAGELATGARPPHAPVAQDLVPPYDGGTEGGRALRDEPDKFTYDAVGARQPPAHQVDIHAYYSHRGWRRYWTNVGDSYITFYWSPDPANDHLADDPPEGIVVRRAQVDDRPPTYTLHIVDDEALLQGHARVRVS